MWSKAIKFSLLTVVLILAASAVMAEKGRLYGRIYTDRGDVLEGIIRWDKNEVAWDDIMNGNKDRESIFNKTSGRKKYKDRDREIKIFGYTILNDDYNWSGRAAQSGLAFGHIKKLTAHRSSGVELLLKNGKIVELQDGSTDFGSGIREIVIETKNEGELELDWNDIEYIEFFDGGDVNSSMGDRLYGTIITDRGGEYTGWICWDVDEALGEDILDGEDRGRSRKIKFKQIERIERISSNASLVVTKDGKEIRLDDSNDVDSGNRGITISDPALGAVIVQWDEFESLELKDPPSSAYPDYDDFDGGKELYGTVYDDYGNSHEGYIRWDDDEEYTWEILDGNYRDIEFNIFFSNIKSIERISRRSSRVILWDGREFRLRDSNDVDDDNKGIIVRPTKDYGDEDDMVFLDWDEFEKIEFRR